MKIVDASSCESFCLARQSKKQKYESEDLPPQRLILRSLGGGGDSSFEIRDTLFYAGGVGSGGKDSQVHAQLFSGMLVVLLGAIDLGQQEMGLGNAVAFIGLDGFLRVALGSGHLVEMNLCNGAIEVAVDALHRLQ